jgi:hypothetical protein
MSQPIDLRYVAESQPSLCIPCVYKTISENRIRSAFEEVCLGKIARIDIKNVGEKFNRVFIHFKEWYWNDNAKMSRMKLLAGEEIKIVYDNPWFWKVSASKWMPVNRCDVGPRQSDNARVRIAFENDDLPHIQRPRPSQRPRPNPSQRPRADSRQRPRPREDKPRSDSRERARPDEQLPIPFVQPFVKPPPRRLVKKLEVPKLEVPKLEEQGKEDSDESSDDEDVPYVMDELYADIVFNHDNDELVV